MNLHVFNSTERHSPKTLYLKNFVSSLKLLSLLLVCIKYTYVIFGCDVLSSSWPMKKMNNCWMPLVCGFCWHYSEFVGVECAIIVTNKLLLNQAISFLLFLACKFDVKKYWHVWGISYTRSAFFCDTCFLLIIWWKSHIPTPFQRRLQVLTMSLQVHQCWPH